MPTTGIPTHARHSGPARLRARPRGVRATLLVLAALLALAGAPAAARAHSFTVTRVELIKDDDRFDLTLWLGQQDLLQNVLGDSTGRTAFADVAELRQTGRRTGDYVQAHVEARVAEHVDRAVEEGEEPQHAAEAKQLVLSRDDAKRRDGERDREGHAHEFRCRRRAGIS